MAPLLGPVQATAVTSGNAAWGRLRDAAGTRREDGVVGAEVILDRVDIVAGGTVTLNQLNLTKANS